MKYVSLKKQQGVVLLWALGILLVLTIVSVSSVRVSNLNTVVSGNSLASMMVYQGAESTLSKVGNMNYIYEASKEVPDRSKAVPALDLPNEAVSGGSLNSQAIVSFVGYAPCSTASSIAMSTSASAAAGTVKCQIYRVDASSRLRGTGAKKDHVLGVSFYNPTPNSSQ